MSPLHHSYCCFVACVQWNYTSPPCVSMESKGRIRLRTRAWPLHLRVRVCETKKLTVERKTENKAGEKTGLQRSSMSGKWLRVYALLLLRTYFPRTSWVTYILNLELSGNRFTHIWRRGRERQKPSYSGATPVKPLFSLQLSPYLTLAHRWDNAAAAKKQTIYTCSHRSTSHNSTTVLVWDPGLLWITLCFNLPRWTIVVLPLKVLKSTA